MRRLAFAVFGIAIAMGLVVPPSILGGSGGVAFAAGGCCGGGGGGMGRPGGGGHPPAMPPRPVVPPRIPGQIQRGIGDAIQQRRVKDTLDRQRTTEPSSVAPESTPVVQPESIPKAEREVQPASVPKEETGKPPKPQIAREQEPKNQAVAAADPERRPQDSGTDQGVAEPAAKPPIVIWEGETAIVDPDGDRPVIRTGMTREEAQEWIRAIRESGPASEILTEAERMPKPPEPIIIWSGESAFVPADGDRPVIHMGMTREEAREVISKIKESAPGADWVSLAKDARRPTDAEIEQFRRAARNTIWKNENRVREEELQGWRVTIIKADISILVGIMAGGATPVAGIKEAGASFIASMTYGVTEAGVEAAHPNTEQPKTVRRRDGKVPRSDMVMEAVTNEALGHTVEAIVGVPGTQNVVTAAGNMMTQWARNTDNDYHRSRTQPPRKAAR